LAVAQEHKNPVHDLPLWDIPASAGRFKWQRQRIPAQDAVSMQNGLAGRLWLGRDRLPAGPVRIADPDEQDV
jgi:hypothetical protein